MNAEMLARALGAVRSGRQWKCRCVAHDDAGPSMIIFDGRERVQVRCLAGCETLDVIAALKARGLWERDAQDDTYAKRINMRPPAEPDREQQRMRDRARRIWEETTECESTMAEDYFEGRDIWTVAKELPSIVRFHPRCPRRFEPCDRVDPELIETGGRGQRAACLLHDPAAVAAAERDGSGSTA